MTSDPLPYRRSTRLPGYDYSLPGLYFLTIVTAGRASLFGSVSEGRVYRNDAGKAVTAVWDEIQQAEPAVRLIESVLMPDHLHAVVEFLDLSDAQSGSAGGSAFPIGTYQPGKTRPYQKITLTEVVRRFKSFSARRVNLIRATPGQPVWQRGYYDHIIRDEADGQRILEYLRANPDQWQPGSTVPALD